MDNKTNGKIKNSVLLILTVTVVLAVIAGVFIYLFWQREQILTMHEDHYQIAVEAMDAGNYEAAKRFFDIMGNYKDAEELGKQCDVMIEVNRLYGATGDNLQEQEEKNARYEQAKNLVSENYYAEALAIFIELGDYKDSANFIELCIGQLGFYQYVYYNGKGE